MIIINDEEALKIPCTDVTSDEAGAIIDKLESELKHSAELGRAGIGLAAPQIGIGKNLAIVRLDKYKVNLVNCKIAQGYDKTIFKDEGCLSFPNQSYDTYRYQEIYVVSNLVEPHCFTATGLLAVCIQHELDHLNGVLLPSIGIKSELPKNKVRPNDLCFCNSGKKYKKCCQNK